MFDFKNIDSFTPGKFEAKGMLKGKRWYRSPRTEGGNLSLFKPKRTERGNKKIFCGNHYGELIGYELAKRAEKPACKVELAHLSKYFPDIHKERNKGNPIEQDGCISYSELEPNSELIAGEVIIEWFEMHFPEEYNKITKNDSRRLYKSDNIELILAATEAKLRASCANEVDSETLEKKVKENREALIDMMIYDCLYGNNDRHDENWSIEKNDKLFSIYKLYDNERVLGLYENQDVIENAVQTGSVESVSDDILFSRMKIPGERKKNSTYKDVLKYLMENYTNETNKSIKEYLEANSPETIYELLHLCEGLPKCYKEFGYLTYKSRYEFAKQLCKDLENLKTDFINERE